MLHEVVPVAVSSQKTVPPEISTFTESTLPGAVPPVLSLAEPVIDVKLLKTVFPW